jgi:hypothetical protein
VVALYAATSGPGRDTHGGMAAFGDSILFLAIFAVASLPVTGAALFFLRPYPGFWRALAALAVVVALTGLVVLADSLATAGSSAGALLGRWSMWSPIRVLLAPMLALTSLTGGLLAPSRAARLVLLGAGAVEVLLFLVVVLSWVSH